MQAAAAKPRPRHRLLRPAAERLVYSPADDATHTPARLSAARSNKSGHGGRAAARWERGGEGRGQRPRRPRGRATGRHTQHATSIHVRSCARWSLIGNVRCDVQQLSAEAPKQACWPWKTKYPLSTKMVRARRKLLNLLCRVLFRAEVSLAKFCNLCFAQCAFSLS
uniref:Uncharacterized protein n=1 Tax=Oryza glaberrima TaxID=4538 RepID=A0A679BB30_ORYGL|nr:hypothetical protein [Oryza glaberrima]